MKYNIKKRVYFNKHRPFEPLFLLIVVHLGNIIYMKLHQCHFISVFVTGSVCKTCGLWDIGMLAYILGF